MEKTLYIKSIAQIKNHAALKEYNRLYIGSEFCATFIPQEKTLEECFLLCEKYNLTFSLVLPFCIFEEFRQIRKALKKIYAWRPHAEIIINDLGHLWLLESEFPAFHRIWGRLLTKMKADEQLRNIKHKEYQFISIDQEYTIDLLRTHGVERIELNNIQQGILREAISGILPASLYMPYVYIATSRKCLSRLSAHNDFLGSEADYFVSVECAYPCQEFYVSLASHKLISGNSLFYINNKIPSNIDVLKVNRIVTEKLIFEEVE